MRFKKGPFYVQSTSQASITPLIILGSYELWPPNYFFTCPGQVILRYLPPIPAGDLPKNKDDVSRMVRHIMFDAISSINSQPQHYQPGAPLTWPLRLLNLASIGIFWRASYSLWQAFTRARHHYEIGRPAVWGLFIAYSITVTGVLYVFYCKHPWERGEKGEGKEL